MKNQQITNQVHVEHTMYGFCLNIYLFISKSYRGQTDLPSAGSLSKMATMTSAGLAQSQELEPSLPGGWQVHKRLAMSRCFPSHWQGVQQRWNSQHQLGPTGDIQSSFIFYATMLTPPLILTLSCFCRCSLYNFEPKNTGFTAELVPFTAVDA